MIANKNKEKVWLPQCKNKNHQIRLAWVDIISLPVYTKGDCHKNPQNIRKRAEPPL